MSATRLEPRAEGAEGLDPKTAETPGLYRRAKELSAEHARIDAELGRVADHKTLPPVADLLKRLTREFDRLD